MGITDSDHACNLCGEHLESCPLCIDDPDQRVVSIKEQKANKALEEFRARQKEKK